MAGPKLKVYVDVVSPFGYLAYHIMRHDPAFSKCEITYVPIFLGGVMKACGNTPPINIKNKSTWIGLERKRWASTFNVPIAADMPEGFPVLTLTVMRAICALMLLHPGPDGQEILVKVLDSLLPALWVDHKKVHEKDVFGPMLETIIGKSEVEKVMQMVPKEGKEALAQNTDKALADGAFGLPWIVATNSKGESEDFWGVDHLGQLCDFLGIEKPKSGGWKSVL